jgi:hypothetical protein
MVMWGRQLEALEGLNEKLGRRDDDEDPEGAALGVPEK